MKCSRIALLLVLAVLGEVAVARATDNVAAYPLSKAAVLRLIYLDVVRPAEWFDNATDWRDSDLPMDGRDDNSNSSNGVADEEATSEAASSADNDKTSSDSSYNDYYGNDANTTEQSNVEDNTDRSNATEQQSADDDDSATNTLAQSNVNGDADASKSVEQSSDEDDMVASDRNAAPAANQSNNDDQQSTIAETSDHEIQTDGNTESFDFYGFDFSGAEYVYCNHAEKFAARAEVAVAYCSMLSKLKDWAAWPAAEWHGAVRGISDRIVRIDWAALFHGQAGEVTVEHGSPDNEEQP